MFDENNNIFEDYLTVFDSVSELVKMPQNEFCDVLDKTFTPLVQIAEKKIRFLSSPAMTDLYIAAYATKQ